MTTGYEVCKMQIKAQVMECLQNCDLLEDMVVYEQIETIAQRFSGYRLLRPQDKQHMIKEVFNSIRKMDLLEELLEQPLLPWRQSGPEAAVHNPPIRFWRCTGPEGWFQWRSFRF